MLALGSRSVESVMPFMPFMPCLIRRFLAGLALAAGLATLATARENDAIAGTLADELLADRVGLVREWIVQIPFDSAGYRLQHIVVADGMVMRSPATAACMLCARRHSILPATQQMVTHTASRKWARSCGRSGLARSVGLWRLPAWVQP